MQPAPENKELLTPVLSDKVEFHDFGSGKYLVTHAQLGYRVLISLSAFELLNLANGERTLTEIAEQYMIQSGNPMNTATVYHLFYEQFAQYGFIEQDWFVVEKRKRSAYLRLSIVFFKSKYSDFLVRYLTFLFKPKVFIPILLLLFCVLLFMIIIHFSLVTGSFKNIAVPDFIFCFFMFGIGTLFHEIGHATACKYFGAQHGDIGFGFYLLRPVLFADVSDIWKLQPMQRIVVNLAGVYFASIYACILLLIYYVTGNTTFLIIPVSIFISSLFSLNPLLRYDGYWILTDWLNVPNLRKTAATKAALILKRIIKKVPAISFSSKDYFLAFYSLAGRLFVFFFLFSIIFYSSSSLIYFPINVFNYFKEIFTGVINFSISGLYVFIVPLFFYILLYRYLKSLFLKYVWKKIK